MKSGRVRLQWIVFSALVLAGAAVLLPACRSRSKAQVERALLALDGNAVLASAGLRRTALDPPTAGETEVVHVLLPALAPPGAPRRRPLVLVHGTPATLFSWSDLVGGGSWSDALRAERDVHLIEVAGHGVAPGEGGRFGFQRCADFVAAALRGLGLSDVCLVGHSYGGEFAWRAALDHPELVGALVLIDSAGYRRAPDGFLPEEVTMRELPRWLGGLGWMLNSRGSIRAALAPHYRGDVAAERVEEMYLCCSNPLDWRAMIDLARDENGEREAELARILAPTLLVWGDDDLAYPAQSVGARFAADLPRARLVVIEGCGHYPPEERPGELAAELLRFLRETDGP